MSTKRTSLRLTPEVHSKIITALRAGNYVETSAAFAGISRPTLYRWLEKGDRALDKLELEEELTENEIAYLNFRNDVEEARAQASVRAVSLINQAAQNSWQAAAWWLERTNPKLWGRQIRTEISGPDAGPINVSITNDELETLVQTILKKDEE